MDMKTGFHHLLRDAANDYPDNPAISFGADTLTYAQLWEMALGACAAFRALGVARGDRVAVYLEKRFETVAALLGISAAGAILVPINPLLRARQVTHILSDSGARLIITSSDRLRILSDSLSDAPQLTSAIVVDHGGQLPTAGRIVVRSWEDAVPAGAGVLPLDVIDLDLAAILYTSGSTGQPKGVVLSHRNLLAGAESVTHYLGNTSSDVLLAALPLSFDAGLSQITTAFHVGAHVVLLNYVLPNDVPKLCARYGVTGITAVPPLWIQLADLDWPDPARQALRYFANTGGRMPQALLSRLRQQFPAALPYLMYGLTEAFRSTYLDPAEVDRRPDSIGKAIPNTEILVLRPDGTPCEAEEEGELVHRGALVAQGYWNDPARTAARFRPLSLDGQSWRSPELAVFSGDIVRRDAEGFLYYVGRRDEMIKTSGYRVSPNEIEEAAFATGLVRDVVALGVEDERLGHRIVLLVGPAEDGPVDTSALLRALKQSVPLYMVPSAVVALPSIPRSPNGKFDRALLRQQLQQSQAASPDAGGERANP